MGETDQWTRLPFGRATAAEQIARTDARTDAVARGECGPTLRWYGYVGCTVILGVGQSQASIRPDLTAEAGAPLIVKRSSGGAAVLADASFLALDVIVPSTSPHAGHDVVEAYRWPGEAWQRAICRIRSARGFPADETDRRLTIVPVSLARQDRARVQTCPAGTPERWREAVCFGTLSPYEVGWNRSPDEDDRLPVKLVGLSQIRRRGVVLYQVGVHSGFDAMTMARTLAVDVAERDAVASVLQDHIGHLGETGLTEADWPDLMAAVETELLGPN
ncbi:MAG: hypothetical protein EXR45_05305 [Chloroflexi bacterium]|nr:hypothetical protein [Chloroflexota bacterium]